MKFLSLTAGALLATAAVLPAVAEPMAMDTPVNMGSLTVACSGVGSAKDDPQWRSWPTRIEFSNGRAEYYSGVRVVISHRGSTDADFECAGPWVLVKGPAGSYKATATLLWEANKTTKSAVFSLGSRAQKRVIIQFEPSVPHVNSVMKEPGGPAAVAAGTVPPPLSGQ